MPPSSSSSLSSTSATPAPVHVRVDATLLSPTRVQFAQSRLRPHRAEGAEHRVPFRLPAGESREKEKFLIASASAGARGLLTTEDAEDAEASAVAADVDFLLGSVDASNGVLLPLDRTSSTTGACNTGGDTVSASAQLQHSTALQEEQAGQLRLNAEHFSGVLATDLGVLHAAEAKAGATKLEWVRDHSWKALGTTCPTMSNVVVVVAIAFLVTFFVIRFT
ncbi:hypothetical protein EDB92DRAFT_1815563 [Lactarius akahatsu]|uniref:Uncharacterized protein n=1 Tax=Lactarius akahatsu TaxID=416441 RepID=A0AAD4LI04_9AGAM|nr:hypothetical protein EDB92DRAFT_1815563 [Lactarius akahatsu]